MRINITILIAKQDSFASGMALGTFLGWIWFLTEATFSFGGIEINVLQNGFYLFSLFFFYHHIYFSFNILHRICNLCRFFDRYFFFGVISFDFFSLSLFFLLLRRFFLFHNGSSSCGIFFVILIFPY